MQHFGNLLKHHMESHGLKKTDVAQAAGITVNYLSVIFGKSTVDSALLEKLCIAAGLPISAVFEPNSYITAKDSAFTLHGNATYNSIGENLYKQLLAEKERYIRNLELRQKNLWFSWRNLLSENLSCMWSLLLCVDGEFDLRRRLLSSSCRVCMHHAHKHSQCNLFAFVLFVIAKIIGLVVLCFRYQ